MALGRKGQFYLIVTVFVISIAIGVAYFTSESKQLEEQTEVESEPSLQTLLTAYENELRAALEGGFYSGDKYFYDDLGTELEFKAAAKGYLLDVQCDNTTINSYTEQLDCELTLTVNENTLSTSFTYTYAVPFNVTFYADVYFTEETQYFLLGDTVYYRITTTNTNPVDVEIYYPNDTMYDSYLNTTYDYSTNGSFAIGSSDPTGEWYMTINNSVDPEVSRSFFVQLASVSIVTFDENDNPQDTFNKGDLVECIVYVEPTADIYVSTTVNGQYRDYGWSSSSPAYAHEFNLTISNSEVSGVMNITATEQNFFTSNSTTITILAEPYGQFIELILSYTFPYADAFAEACGYTTWYEEENTSHNAIPFTVENSTNNAVIRVEGETEIVETPHAYASKIHIITSGCDIC